MDAGRSRHRVRYRVSALVGLVVLLALVTVSTDLSPASAQESKVAASVPQCATSGLVIWLTGNGAAAGTDYSDLEFTNLSGHTCTLYGFAGVSAVGLSGQQIGKVGSWGANGKKPAVVSLAPDATAGALLGVTDAANYPSSICHEVLAAGLRVYPPDQKASKVVPYPLTVCSGKGPSVLSVQAIQKTPLAR
jgi:hypothetical protein